MNTFADEHSGYVTSPHDVFRLSPAHVPMRSHRLVRRNVPSGHKKFILSQKKIGTKKSKRIRLGYFKKKVKARKRSRSGW